VEVDNSSVDDSGALVHQLNDPSSLIIERSFNFQIKIAVDTFYERQATQDDPLVVFIMNVMDAVGSIRAVLSGGTIHLNKLEDQTGIFDRADSFERQSRENETVQHVTLCLATDPDAHRYKIWDKIAKGIGNLQALREITIVDAHIDYTTIWGANGDDDDEEEDALVPDWETLACILRRLRRGIDLRMQDGAVRLWDTETLPTFAGVIRGHPMIKSFSTGAGFPFHCLDILCSALLTLPALESISFEQLYDEGPEEGQSLESMVKLLQSPSLREVNFISLDFTNTLSQAVAKALKEKSEITDIYTPCCSFPVGGVTVIASALATNTKLKHMRFSDAETDEVFYQVLAAALLSNSTLQYLEFFAPGDSGSSCLWLSPLFLALQVNSGLKELWIRGIDLVDEKLSKAIRLGLGRNSTLERLRLTNIFKSGDNDTCLWREALSFLPTNPALKILHMQFERNVTESHVAAIRMEILATLCENESLEALIMPSEGARLEDYPAYIAAIQPNTTLKRLGLQTVHFDVDEDEMKDLIPVLTKNYGLEELLGLRIGAGDSRSIFDLNRAGRRYLVQDGSSISKGVDVLSRVSSDINSVFLHLLENPRLCDRSAIENARLTSPGNRSGGKRELQAPSHTGKEPRRRLE
jgi:hypothetical protein